jgi:peptidoglycan/xylan/chitin deacetylase (PgdA/CDA1 family)
VRKEMTRAHGAIEKATGRQVHYMRPPYGHLGGSTMLAADSLGYDVVLWSHKMQEAKFKSDPTAQVRDIVTNVTPGSIVLAHDVGSDDRLVALRHLNEMFTGLKARGFRFVTIPELIATGRTSVARPV